MFRRSLIVFSLLLLPVAASAQSNEIGLFISTSQFSDDEITGDLGDVDVEFDEDMGYGVSYNRYWTDAFSTEFAYQKLGADLTLSAEDFVDQDGELDLDMLTATAQLHFMRGGIVSPYIGGGVAYVSGEAGSIDPDELQDADLENEIDWLANAGIDIGLSRGFAIFIDGKYVMYEARGEDDDDDTAIEINPLILSAGIKLRF